MNLKNYALASMALFSVNAAYANTSVNGNRFTGGLLLQDTSYDTDSDDDTDVEGTLLVGGYKAQISPQFAIGGGLGLMIDGEINAGGSNGIEDGSGFRLFVDGQFEVHRFENNKILITGALNHDRFSFEGNNVDVDFTTTDVKIGGLFVHSVQQFDLYAGLEAIIYSNGEFEYDSPTLDFDTDADRDDRLNLRLGGAFNVNRNLALRADLLVLGEQTILLAADFAM